MNETADLKRVPGFPAYFVSRDGKVFSTVSGKPKELAQVSGSEKGRYRYVNLGKKKRIGVHQLVAICFLPPPGEFNGKPQTVVRHRDNDPTNNHADNLRWGTQGQNLADRVEHGTMTIGDRNGSTKVGDDVVASIRLRRIAKETCRAIAADVGLSAAQVHRIGLGQRRVFVPGQAAGRQRRSRKDGASVSA